MPGGIKIEGTDALRDTAKKLREAGQKDVLNALRRGIRNASKEAVEDVARVVRVLDVEGVPMPAHIRGRSKGARRATGAGGATTSGRVARLTYDVTRSRGNLARILDRAHGRAGLRETIARALTTQIGMGGGSASVRIKVDRNKMPPDQRLLPGHLEKGTWRHPVFGNVDRWVAQRSTPEWFAGTLRRHRDNVRAAINREVFVAMRKVQS